ncbi:MAG: hypothetical protein ACRDPM_23015 [Solirubrobacteraceae bacterium]
MATISSLLADHVSLQVRSVDRLFLQGYVPRLQTEGQVIRFLLDRGFPIPSSAVLGKIGRGYTDAINQFVADNEIPVVKFVKGDVKEEIAREHFQRAEAAGRFGVVMLGVRQEKTSAWRGWRGYGYDLAFRQLEISDTRVFDRPAAGRAWFEQTLPDQLTLGRPEQVAVVCSVAVSRARPQAGSTLA